MNTNKNHSNDAHAEEAQEILNDMPHGLIRWGSGIVLVMVLLLIGISCFFSYPDAVYAEITIETIQSPALIVARSSGKLEQLFVKNQQLVDSGAPLAVIENAADCQDMLKLSAKLAQWNPALDELSQGLILFGDTLMQLGTVQAAYTDFSKALHDFDNYLHFAYYQQKISLQRSQQQILELRLKEMAHQREWQKKQLLNADALYKRDSLLYVKGITAEESLEESRNNLLKAKQSVSALNASLYELETQLKQLDESLLDLSYNEKDALDHYKLNLKTSYEQLLTQVRSWEQTFLLSSPMRGTVNLMGNWSQNRQVSLGETVFTILPTQMSPPIGKALVPAKGSGKISIHDLVHVHMDNYPDQEFGFVDGYINSISKVPLSDGSYVAEIRFPHGLTTNYGFEIQSSGQLRGTAEIITNELTLIERIILPTKHYLKKHFYSYDAVLED